MKKKDRQISTMFFERTFASKNKKAMLEKGRVPKSGDLLTAEVKLIFFALVLLTVINFCSRLPNCLSAPEQAGSLSYGEPAYRAVERGREFLVNLVNPELNLAVIVLVRLHQRL
jgi:flagellar biosynthesis protein FlhB